MEVVYPFKFLLSDMPKLKPPKLELANGEEEEEENVEPIPSHPTWSGSISIGLVNIPVRAIPITLERKISYRMLHQKCKTPISYKLCVRMGVAQRGLGQVAEGEQGCLEPLAIHFSQPRLPLSVHVYHIGEAYRDFRIASYSSASRRALSYTGRSHLKLASNFSEVHLRKL